jgi:hypothetical protein
LEKKKKINPKSINYVLTMSINELSCIEPVISQSECEREKEKQLSKCHLSDRSSTKGGSKETTLERTLSPY